MGKHAATKVLAGAEGIGRIQGSAGTPQRPQTRARELPQARNDPGRDARSGRSGGLRRDLGTHGARPHRALPAGLLRQLRRQGRLLPGGATRWASARLEALVVRGGGGRGELAGQGCAPASARCSTSSTPSRTSAAALIVEVHAGGPGGAGKTGRSDEKGGRFHRSGTRGGRRVRVAAADRPGGDRRRDPRDHPLAALHRGNDGFRELLPEFMYFAVLPYFGAEAASAEMQAARA